jgi:hypothetical protein
VGIGNSSLAFVVSGDTGGTLRVLGGNLLNDVSVAGAGDVDGDGHADVVLGAPFYVVENVMLGRAQVFSGQTGGVLLTLDGTEADGHFGAEVAGGRDLDGDGLLDIAVASPDAGGGGVVQVFDALDGSLRSTLAASGPTDALGTQLARLGDVDGDLQDDLLVLATGGGPNQAGTVRVYQDLDRSGPPVLTGTGSLVPGTPFALTLTGALPAQLAWFVVGTSYVGLPFLGGTLGPSPDVIRLFSTNAAGGLALESTWPTGLPVGTSLWVQAWIADPDAPQGYASTNAVAASQL